MGRAEVFTHTGLSASERLGCLPPLGRSPLSAFCPLGTRSLRCPLCPLFVSLTGRDVVRASSSSSYFDILRQTRQRPKRPSKRPLTLLTTLLTFVSAC